MNEWNNAPTEEMSAEQKLTERQDEAVQTQEAAEREEQAEAAQMTGEAERNTAELPESGEDSAEACPEDVEEASEKGAAPETEEVADGDAEPREEATEEWDASEEDMADGFEDTEDTDQAETEEVSAEEEDMAAEDTGAAAEGNTVAARPETKPDGSGEEAVDSASLASIEPLLDDRIVRAVREMGFEKLTPIQVQAIPYLLDGEDIIGQAQTGTGKTAAFAIPALQKIDPDLRKLQTIILCPTRELAMQAAEEIRNIAKFMHGIKVLPVYGGQDISKQIRGLKDVQIVVGTPGRVMDHMRRRTMKLDYVNMVVLDEADEMLDMGFREDMELILGEVPNAHQTALFSATMPQPILEIANRFQKDARLVRVAAKELTIPLVSQRYYRVKSHDKDAACIRLLEYYQPKLCLIFCNTKIKVDEVSELLKKAEFRAEGLHGDMSQHQRDVAMNHFRNGSTNILIATDVAARGIEYYVHRIGRTGRAGKTGRSFTFVSGRELFRLRQIERFCHTTIEERELPNASKVMKAKAEKYLNRSWELHGRDDIDLMKSYVERKMEEEGCDALELAAAMLKYHIGDIGPEIEVDDYEARGGRGDRGRGRGRRRGGREENREGRRRRERDEERRGRDRDGERDSRRRRERDEEHEERRRRDRDEERESRRSFERDEERESRSRDRDEERDSHRSFERDEGRDSRRNFDRGEERDSRQGFGHDEEREGRRSFDREEEREGRRRRDREEERGDRDSRVRFGWGDDRGSRRKRDREDDRDSRRRRDREESRDDRGRRGRDNDRDSRRGRDRGEERVHGRFERESSRDSRRRGREEERDSRRKRDREESRPSRLRDVRMDGSDRGLAFSFPKKKRK